MSLIFPAAGRPTSGDVARVLAAAAGDLCPAISHDAGEGWVELLANGLAFDLSGLAPGAGAVMPAMQQAYDLAALPDAAYAAITLRAGPHMAGAEAMLPVVRTQLGIALALSTLPGLGAVVWHPAGTAMSVAHFARLTSAWLADGPFPALGLTALTRMSDGDLVSRGLSFFCGQELRIKTTSTDNPAQAGKIAIRLIHSLVEGGSVKTGFDFTGPDGERLRGEPADSGKIVEIWYVA